MIIVLPRLVGNNVWIKEIMDHRHTSVPLVIPIKVSSEHPIIEHELTCSVWNVRFNDAGAIPNLPTPTPGFLEDIVVGSEIKDAAGQGQRLRLAGRQDLCVWVAGGAVVASEVVM
jgi:hypothetical protein